MGIWLCFSWSSESLLNRPFCLKSFLQGSQSYSSQPRPFGQIHRSFVKSVHGYLMNRRGQCVLGRPSILESFENSSGAKPQDLSPFRNGHTATVVAQKSVVAFVPRLFCACRPATVGRFIMTVIIDAIYLVGWAWNWPHVERKLMELFPSLADMNAPSSISSKILVRWSVAPVHHVRPNGVNGSHACNYTLSPVYIGGV